MQNEIIKNSLVNLDIYSGQLTGKPVIKSIKKIADLKNVFADEESRFTMQQDKPVYEVEVYLPEEEDTEGGLYFGTTIIHPGKVGSEYFMTRGHFHAKRDTAEYYWGMQGEGVLILMDSERNIWAEKMIPGSLHYINRALAHRVANTGASPLIFNACWPSDAGHNYEEIAQNGFAARLIEENSQPVLKSEIEVKF